MSISGNILDNSLYGSKYVLNRSYTFCGGRPILRIDDQIFNEGFHAQPLMILQHMNFGFPLIDQGTQLIFPKNTVCHPRDNVAQLSLERAHHFEAPNENYQEQVFYHDFSTCSDDVVEVIIVNHQLQHWAGTGLSCHLRFDRRQYPYLVQWKLAKEGEYVLGLEPANCHVEGRHAEKLTKSLEHLKARETKNFSLEIELRLGRSRISEEPILFSLPHHQDHT